MDGDLEHAIIAWNLIAAERALDQLEAEGRPVARELRRHFSSTLNAHINKIGRFDINPDRGCLTNDSAEPDDAGRAERSTKRKPVTSAPLLSQPLEVPRAGQRSVRLARARHAPNPHRSRIETWLVRPAITIVAVIAFLEVTGLASGG